MLVTSIIGPHAWHVSLPGAITPGTIFEVTLYLSAMLTSQTVILWNIYKSYRDRTGKMRPFSEAIRPLVPLALFFALSTLWAVYSPTDLMLLGALCVASSIAHIYYGASVVKEMCEHFQISCFRIKPKIN
ncbi:unnamed protein product [Leptidea sinapis]|uniref:Uncharacterized protein n=1 Tax=Leptidea sinapis TaxID=189913 RepID=A0A5E4QF79_9NEOP|nr:unnamed protein product [Leptidea sinapis]